MLRICYVCESSSIKENYLFFCSSCSKKTSYCSNCNKVLDIVLNSKLFKCGNCKNLVSTIKKEIHYNVFEDNSLTLKNDEESYRQNIINLMQNKNLFPNSSTQNQVSSFNNPMILHTDYSQSSSNFKSKHILNNEEKSGDYNQIINKTYHNRNEESVIENMDCGEFLEKCGIRDSRSSQSNGGNGQSEFKLLISRQNVNKVTEPISNSMSNQTNRGSIKHQKSNSVFAVYNKSERLSASKSPIKKKPDTSFKPVTLHMADVSSYIQNYNESNLIDSRNTSFGTTTNLSNSKQMVGSFFSNSQFKTFFSKNPNETLNFSSFSSQKK